MSKIVVVGADPQLTRGVMSIIQKDGHELLSASGIREGIKLAEGLPFDSLLLVNTNLSDGHATEFIDRMREKRIVFPVLIFSTLTPSENNIRLCSDMESLMPYGEVRGFVFTQKFDKTLLPAIKNALPIRKKEFFDRTRLLPRNSSAAQELREHIKRIAPLDTNTLILGEPGLCKPTVAYVLHTRSARKDNPFVEVGHCDFSASGGKTTPCANCKLAESYIQSHNGTLYMRNLHGFCKYGIRQLENLINSGTYDVRIISSADPSIYQKVSDGDFDGIMMLRLSMNRIDLTPLRKLPEDIETLSNVFLREFAEGSGTERCKLTRKAVKMLQAYPFPNNTLELKILMFQCAAICTSCIIGDEILTKLLPNHKKQPVITSKKEKEKQWFIDHFKDGGTIEEAAEFHKVKTRTIYNRLLRCGLDSKGREICAVS